MANKADFPSPQGSDGSEIFHQPLSSKGEPVGKPVAGLPTRPSGGVLGRRELLLGAAGVAAVRGGSEIFGLQRQIDQLQRQAAADFDTQYATYRASASYHTDFVLDGFREIAPGVEFVYPTSEPAQIDPALLLRNDVLTALGDQEKFREIFYPKPSGDGAVHIEETYVSRTDAYRNLLAEFKKAGVARGIPEDSLVVYLMAYAFSRPFQDEAQTPYQQQVQDVFHRVDELIELGNGMHTTMSLSLSQGTQDELSKKFSQRQMGIIGEQGSGEPGVITLNFLLDSFHIIAGEKVPE